MTGFNLPPGVSPSDIPGNDAPGVSVEEEQVAQLVDKICVEGLFPGCPEEDQVLEIVAELAAERDRLRNEVDGLRAQIDEIQCYLEMKI